MTGVQPANMDFWPHYWSSSEDFSDSLFTLHTGVVVTTLYVNPGVFFYRVPGLLVVMTVEQVAASQLKFLWEVHDKERFTLQFLETGCTRGMKWTPVLEHSNVLVTQLLSKDKTSCDVYLQARVAILAGAELVAFAPEV